MKPETEERYKLMNAIISSLGEKGREMRVNDLKTYVYKKLKANLAKHR